MALGIYVSVPFCRSKCSFCNFASGVFSRAKMDQYVDRLAQEIFRAEATAEALGVICERSVDSIYLGGGTPSTLAPEQIRGIINRIRGCFDVRRDAEITVECAPGTLTPEIVEELVRVGTTRVSLGAQSFVDEETRSVGRLHTARHTAADIQRLQEAGISNINVDLIAGLPHQTPGSWRHSLEQLGQSQVAHASVYLLEIDEDSRLGQELIAGGSRYHAHHVPDSDLAADFYLEALEFLDSCGLHQYEISNFARSGCESRHNLKYWTRQPYLGFGLDAHSMLLAKKPSTDFESVRFGNTDDLDAYLAGSASPAVTIVGERQSREELLFLGLRLNQGIDKREASGLVLNDFPTEIQELIELGLLDSSGDHLRLTSRGRLLSNEVFARFITSPTIA
ncbi:MAG TPA: radical SAM family heme chaperone HemW [Terriglobales bacterium]|nr:radical SAM family heme chaperone HemW [Terriglobales bacterium]